MLSFLSVSVLILIICKQDFDHLIFLPLEGFSTGSATTADTNIILELKDPDIRMQWFLLQLMCLHAHMHAVFVLYKRFVGPPLN